MGDAPSHTNMAEPVSFGGQRPVTTDQTNRKAGRGREQSYTFLPANTRGSEKHLTKNMKKIGLRRAPRDDTG